MDGEHGDWRFTDHPLRGAPEQNAVESGVTVRCHHDQVCFEILGRSDDGGGRVALNHERLAAPVREIPIGDLPQPIVYGCFPTTDWFQRFWQRRGDDVDNTHCRPLARGETLGYLDCCHRLCLEFDRAQNLLEELSHNVRA